MKVGNLEKNYTTLNFGTVASSLVSLLRYAVLCFKTLQFQKKYVLVFV